MHPVYTLWLYLLEGITATNHGYARHLLSHLQNQVQVGVGVTVGRNAWQRYNAGWEAPGLPRTHANFLPTYQHFVHVLLRTLRKEILCAQHQPGDEHHLCSGGRGVVVISRGHEPKCKVLLGNGGIIRLDFSTRGVGTIGTAAWSHGRMVAWLHQW